MILWMLEVSDNGMRDLPFKGKGKNPTGKGKGAGKMVQSQANKQKIQGLCWNRGKTGHQSTDCWARPQQQQSRGQSNSLGKGNDVKGKSGKCGGKKGKSKDAGALVWNQQLGSPVASSVASSTPQTEKSTTVGTIDTIGRTALDRCVTTMAQQVVNPRWTTFNVDTGVGGTVWRMSADYACEKVSGPAGRNYKTATGEIVEGQGRFRVRCQNVWGHRVHMTGEKTSVHKPLLSAGDVTDKGHALWLDGNVGKRDSPILTVMRMRFEKVCEQHSWNGAIDLTKERGVYNLYVQVAGGEGNVERAVDVSSNEMEGEVERGGRVPGGPSAGEPVTPREMGVLSDGGEEAVAPTVPPVPAKPTQAERDEHYATGHIVRGVSIVPEVVGVCHHT